jgi:CyaY protein
MNAPFEPTPLNDSEFHSITASMLARIEATVDQWLQDDVVDIDTNRTGGLLELGFPNGSKIVINTQPPLHEMWLAARQGGFHYKYAKGAWRDTRDGREFFEALSACASEQAGRPLRFEPAVSA